MECSITQMSNNRARLISRDKNSRPGIEKALISKSMKKDARLWTSFSFTLRRVRDSNPRKHPQVSSLVFSVIPIKNYCYICVSLVTPVVHLSLSKSTSKGFGPNQSFP